MDGLHINSGSVLINTKRHGQRKQNRDLASSGSFECSKQSILSSMDKFVRTVQSMRGTILVPSKLRDMRLRQRLPDCQITLLANSANGNTKITTTTTNKGQLNNKNKLTLNSTSSSTKSHNLHSHFHSHYHSLLHNHLQDYHLGYHHSSIHTSTNSTCDSPIGSNKLINQLNYDPAEAPSALMNADLFNFYSMLYDVKQQLLWGPASGQSTIFTNYNTNSDLNQSNTRFLMDKSTLHQLNSTMANCNLASSHSSTLTHHQPSSLLKDNRAESTCSSGYSSNSSTRNSTTNLSFIAQCSPTASIASTTSTNSLTSSSSIVRQLSSAQTSIDYPDVQPELANEEVNNNKLNDSTSSSASSTSSIVADSNSVVVDSNSVASSKSIVDSPQSKTPQSDSDLESELGSDLTDRTSEQITDQTQLLASAFRHHLQALHTILDQLTHSAEYLSRNYELDLDEVINN